MQYEHDTHIMIDMHVPDKGWYARTHSLPLEKNAETCDCVMPRHTLATFVPKYTGSCCQDSKSAAGTCRSVYYLLGPGV